VPLPKQERSAINKANAARSTGPSSEVGKCISKRNSTKHGLTARQLTLPDDDPADVQAHLDEWLNDFPPRNPAERHLVEQCAYAALLQNRVARAHCAAVSDQVNAAESDLEQNRQDDFRAALALLKTDPREAVARLGRSARGLGYLLARWEHLAGQLQQNGSWAHDEAAEVVRLLGGAPEGQQLPAEVVEAWSVWFHSALCRYGPADYRVKHWLEPNRCPASKREPIAAGAMPTREEALAVLTELAEGHVRDLRSRLDVARLLAAQEDANARVRALTLRDEKQARLMIRYQSEARLAFHRAWDALRRSLKEEVQGCSTDADTSAEGRAALAEPVAHEKTPPGVSAPAPEAETRNEPNSGATPALAKASAVKNPPPWPTDPPANGERLLNSYFADSSRPAGVVDVVPIRVGKAPGGVK
jgi:hypothetical protein